MEISDQLPKLGFRNDLQWEADLTDTRDLPEIISPTFSVGEKESDNDERSRKAFASCRRMTAPSLDTTINDLLPACICSDSPSRIFTNIDSLLHATSQSVQHYHSDTPHTLYRWMHLNIKQPSQLRGRKQSWPDRKSVV